MTNRTRKHTHTFYLSDEEEQIFDAKLKLSGANSKADFLRSLILYGCIYEIDTTYLREYINQISAVGNNINQVARYANTNKYVTKEEIENIQKGVDELRQLLKSILSKNPSLNQLRTSANQQKQ